MTRRLFLPLVAAAALGFAQTSYAVLHQYHASLSGPAESPANSSPGTGFTTVDYDDAAHTLHVHVTFQDLVELTSTGAPSGTTASHIHAPTLVPFTSTAGVATTTPTFAGFPLNVRSGVYDNTLDLTLPGSFNNAFELGSTPATKEADLTAAIAAGKAYLNIHTNAFSGGEIRGFLVPGVPEPATIAMAAAGAVGLLIVRRKARRA